MQEVPNTPARLYKDKFFLGKSHISTRYFHAFPFFAKCLMSDVVQNIVLPCFAPLHLDAIQPSYDYLEAAFETASL